jgi:hypothetical protein
MGGEKWFFFCFSGICVSFWIVCWGFAIFWVVWWVFGLLGLMWCGGVFLVG